MIDFEELVVGSLIVSRGVAFRDFELQVEDFDDPCWRRAFEVISGVFAVKGVVDFFLVLEQVKEPVFRQRIVSAVDFAFIPGHLPFYVSKVIEASVDRQLREIAQKAQEGGDVSERMDTLRASMDKLKLVQAFEMPDIRWDLQLMMSNVLNPKQALPTCFPELNSLIVGLKPAGLYVVGARPGVGKTVVGMQLAWEMSRFEDVLFFSLEMDKTDLLKRVVAGELQIDLGLLERGSLTVEQKKRIDDLIVEVESKLIVADKGGQTVSQLRSYLVAVKAKRDVKVVVVDYLQLISPSNPRAPKYEQISQISMDLKNLAKEFGVSVVALAQLNRRVDAKADDLPNASDLRDSGQIEQDADVIVMLSRKQSEQDEAKDKLITQGMHADKVAKGFRSLITFDVVKNRHGATGRFDLRFKGEHSRVVALN
jgi:replicative DNA helicase